MKNLTEKQQIQGVNELIHSLVAGIARILGDADKIEADWDCDLDAFIEIVRNESTSFLIGDEYKDERHCIAHGTLHKSVILSQVILNCIEKIKGQKKL